ncbi:hypothetical protein J4E86_000676 [Alternaria arbusti]|uniref:uncharacterized protein n=1 Tax=Alternaria arbusti TaxID=232088 RepID=UPI00221F45CA|nr:uncharacterized protein J4E86_000676 [Alternaria arbusti]KAI4961647.1 hypothetical protein J4E86_000676 [Alternaria arbusti]
MSRNEHNVDPNTGARSIDLKQPATPMQGSGHASSADQRHDSLTKGDNAHVSPAPLPTGWNGSRIPSNNVPRKAPLAARSSDDISPFIARNIPPTNQQRSTSQSKATSGPSQGNRVRQQKSFNTPPLGTPKRGRPRLDDGVQDNNKAGGLNSQGDTHIGQKASAQPPIGPDNWNEYVHVMEQLWTEEITFDEFGARTQRIFQVFDEGIRRRLNNNVAMKMIVPRLEEERKKGQSTKGAEDV